MRRANTAASSALRKPVGVGSEIEEILRERAAKKEILPAGQWVARVRDHLNPPLPEVGKEPTATE